MFRWTLAVLIVALVGAPAQAGSVASWTEKVHEAMQWGDTDTVLHLMHDPTFEEAMKDKEALFGVCTSLSSCWRILAARGGERLAEIHALVEPYARARLDNDPQEAGDVYCWACVVAAIERTRVARGEKPDLDRWQDAVRAGLMVSNLATGRRDIALDQIRWCGELAKFKSADAEFFLTQADAIQARLMGAGEPDWQLISCVGFLYENKATASAVRGKKRDALRLIEEGIAFVERYLDAEPALDDPRSFIPRARCNLITTARDLRLPCKACYRVCEVPSKEGLLTARLPESGTWQTSVPAGEQDILTIAQFSPEGKSARVIRIRALKHGVPYDMDGTRTGVLAENAKGIAEHTLQGVVWSLEGVTKQGKVRKGRCASGWPSGYHFTLEGRDTRGMWIRSTAVAVSSRGLVHTFLFQVQEWEDGDDGREELEFVLTSLHPPK